MHSQHTVGARLVVGDSVGLGVGMEVGAGLGGDPQHVSHTVV